MGPRDDRLNLSLQSGDTGSPPTRAPLPHLAAASRPSIARLSTGSWLSRPGEVCPLSRCEAPLSSSYQARPVQGSERSRLPSRTSARPRKRLFEEGMRCSRGRPYPSPRMQRRSISGTERLRQRGTRSNGGSGRQRRRRGQDLVPNRTRSRGERVYPAEHPTLSAYGRREAHPPQSASSRRPYRNSPLRTNRILRLYGGEWRAAPLSALRAESCDRVHVYGACTSFDAHLWGASRKRASARDVLTASSGEANMSGRTSEGDGYPNSLVGQALPSARRRTKCRADARASRAELRAASGVKLISGSLEPVVTNARSSRLRRIALRKPSGRGCSQQGESRGERAERTSAGPSRSERRGIRRHAAITHQERAVFIGGAERAGRSRPRRSRDGPPRSTRCRRGERARGLIVERGELGG